ncbi:MAG: hypothetical protein ACOWWO_11385 [Peptococcaceae bacterium]
MSELTFLQKRRDRFHNSLRISIDYFREGHDRLGWDNFQSSMTDLENLLEFEQYFRGSKFNLSEITLALQSLQRCLQNKDVTGLTDVLEFTLFPLTNCWLTEGDGK